MVGELPGRARQIADLQYRQLAQSRIEAAAVADISRQRIEAARGARAVREDPVQVEVSRQKVLVLGQQVGFVEIRQARHP